MDVVEAMVGKAWSYHDTMVRMGLKDEVILPDWYKRHSEVGGAHPRPGYTPFGELSSAFGFRARAIETTEMAAQREAKDARRAIREAEEQQETR